MSRGPRPLRSESAYVYCQGPLPSIGVGCGSWDCGFLPQAPVEPRKKRPVVQLRGVTRVDSLASWQSILIGKGGAVRREVQRVLSRAATARTGHHVKVREMAARLFR